MGDDSRIVNKFSSEVQTGNEPLIWIPQQPYSALLIMIKENKVNALKSWMQ